MINNNKILTVSYGTFSCTLEGFDDSFGTMTAIAEYFRDLSAGDRYFGSEPPQPDAQMLAHIAQKEISRRVEAREHEGKIVLSAHNDAAQKPALAAAVAPVAATAPQTAQHPQEVAAPPSVSSGYAVETTDTQTSGPMADVADEYDDDVAEVTAADVEEEAEPVAEEVSDPTQPEPADTEIAAVTDIVPDQSDADVEAFFAESPSAQDVIAEGETDEMAAFDIPAPAKPAGSSIADKLQRIRAVVSQQNVEATSEYTEDEHAEGTSIAPDDGADDTAQNAGDNAFDTGAVADEPSDTPDIMEDTLRDINDALEVDDATATAAPEETVDAEDDSDDISAILARLGVSDIGNDDEEDAPASMLDAEDDATARDETDAFDDDSIAAEDSDDDCIDDDADADRDDAISNLFEDEKVETADTALETTAPRVRVVKVKRSDLDAAIESGSLEEYDDEDARQTSLSAEQEAELAADLDEVAAELEGRDTQSITEQDDIADEMDLDDKASDDDFDDEAETSEGITRHRLPTLDDDTQDGDVLSRLMAKSDSQMGEADGETRRNAFAHLRAAVAAKKADEAMGADTGEAETDGAYRDDLASVVRPRRPVSTTTRTARPGEGQSAPLKLVAEQRVDVQMARPTGPVRPRRVAAVQSTEQDSQTSGGFIEFAEEMGATKLPDLLEAAAAYMSYVEGREQFSRPQLMTKVRQVEQEDFSREEGLRWFGKLLRDGKIEKKKGGRFQVSDQIGFKPDARAVG